MQLFLSNLEWGCRVTVSVHVLSGVYSGGGALAQCGDGGGEVALFMLCDGGMVCQTEE